MQWKEHRLHRPGQASNFCLDRVTSELQCLVNRENVTYNILPVSAERIRTRPLDTYHRKTLCFAIIIRNEELGTGEPFGGGGV